MLCSPRPSVVLVDLKSALGADVSLFSLERSWKPSEVMSSSDKSAFDAWMKIVLPAPRCVCFVLSHLVNSFTFRCRLVCPPLVTLKECLA